MDYKESIVKIPASIDKSLLIAIKGGRGKKYFLSDPLKPGDNQSKTEKKR